MSGKRILKIESTVPFSSSMYWWLRAVQDLSLEALIQSSRQYDRPYLAWETVRRRRNPFFENGTGFEGYLIGVCRSPDEALEQILLVGQGMLDNIIRLHRSDHSFKSRLIKTLLGEAYYPKAVAEWSVQLGATLARLHCNLLQNPQADDFHAETYRIVNDLPPISYRPGDHTLKQAYVLESNGGRRFVKAVVDLHMLKPLQQDAWLVAQSVGKFGHPLVREFTRYSAR
jgi:hypothetical protein